MLCNITYSLNSSTCRLSTKGKRRLVALPSVTIFLQSLIKIYFVKDLTMFWYTSWYILHKEGEQAAYFYSIRLTEKVYTKVLILVSKTPPIPECVGLFLQYLYSTPYRPDAAHIKVSNALIGWDFSRSGWWMHVHCATCKLAKKSLPRPSAQHKGMRSPEFAGRDADCMQIVANLCQ